MPHPRKRAILPLIEKRLNHFPVVGLLGARQTGKSTTIRDQLSEIRSLKYISLDRDENKKSATNQPSLFITQYEGKKIKTLCIDEIQKAPILFDTIKAEVDEKKRPGRFLISGSTEFSKKTGIQESLTGRIATLRLFPLSLSEIYEKDFFTLKEIKLWIDRGGMPGIFAVRDEPNREAAFDQWIETTCSRDLAQFNIARFNPEFGRKLLNEIATLETPNRTEIAKSLGKTPRQIEAYLQAFKALFILYEIEPYKTSVGKHLFYLFDSGISNALGANSHRRLQSWFLNECYSSHSYRGDVRPEIYYYQTNRGSRLDFIVKTKEKITAYKIYEKEALSTYDLRAFLAFQSQHKEVDTVALASCLEEHKINKNLKIIPWGRVKF